MEKTKKIKIFIGLSYLSIVCLFLFFFFSKFTLQEITSYDFLRDNRAYFVELKNSNIFLIAIIFLVLTDKLTDKPSKYEALKMPVSNNQYEQE